MKSLIRISIDESDSYVVDYIVRTGYYAGQKSTRRFSRFNDMVTFLIIYISNNFLSNE